MWLCKCDCGVEVEARGSCLTRSRRKSCGCLLAKANRRRLTTHGKVGAPEYRAWKNIKARCSGRNIAQFGRYGAVGISIAPEWERDFLAFYAHVGPKPSPQHSIDRIDGSRGYVPGNVRWATPTEQNANRRGVVLVSFGDEKVTLSEASRRLGVPLTTMSARARRILDAGEVPSSQNLSVLKAARRPRAITGGTSDGTVTTASASVGTVLSDYRIKARQAERANHDAARREAGTYVSGQDALQRTLARAEAHWDRCASVHATHQTIMRASVEVKRQLGDLVRAMLRETDYGHSTRGELSEVAVHLGRLDAALKDLARVQAERSRAAVMAERAAATLSAELTEFVERRPCHAV